MISEHTETTEVTAAPEQLRFTGSGSEYFRIWIVNLLLTIVTFGIYSAWAKVRRLQYFYRNVQLAGSGFDYHGRPIAILKGRVIAFVLFGVANAAFDYHLLIGLLVCVPIAIVLPWLLVRSLRFRLHYTSWRGLRFGFDASVGGGYRVFLAWPLAALATLGLLWPAAHRELKAYQHDHSRFGRARFSFHATRGAFYRMYTIGSLLLLVVPLVALATSTTLAGRLATDGHRPPSATIFLASVAVGAVFYLGILVSRLYFVSRFQNIVWNNTRLENHRFSSDVPLGALAWVSLSNLVLTVATLGLFRPFAVVRMARLRVESITMIPSGSLDEFVGEQSAEVDAFGEEVGDLLDIDIAL
ncbi:MAG: DUF898 family protein [Betaproteobacteria bacterium]|nr:DUF898 family protein [Betaproteobacteria bacterium]